MGASLVLALAAAEGARRLLTPRDAADHPRAGGRCSEYFSPEEIERGRRYARPQRALGLAAAGDRPGRDHRPGAPPAAAGCGGPAAGRSPAPRAPPPRSASGSPCRRCRWPWLTRRRAIAAGLDTQTWAAWGRDRAMAGATAVRARGRGGRRGDRRDAALAADLVAGGRGGVGRRSAPVWPPWPRCVLAPIFNDFTPLPEGETRADVLALAAAAGVTVGEVYSVDASRRTTAANAYVTGLGPTKRVVLYDTLLDRYSRDEIRMVVAHELGHVRFRDVPRNVAFAAADRPGRRPGRPAAQRGRQR